MKIDNWYIEDKLEITERIPDNRVLLIFNNDSDGLMFRDWFYTEGIKEFEAWLNEQPRNLYK
jgi:hypothetical protein